jgi:hypothetical protein
MDEQVMRWIRLVNEAEDEEVYFQVKPKKKRGINWLVKLFTKGISQCK